MEATAGSPAATWPTPVEWPLYVTIERAAEIAGVTYEQMRQWADAQADPVPHIRVGRRKKLVRVAALPAYLETKEAV